MRRFLLNYLWILPTFILLAACQPENEAPRLVITPFPTATAGRVINGELPPAELGDGQIAPATAVAIARQPTQTPNQAVCLPLTGEITLETTPPANARIMIEEITRYLSAGGKPDVLAEVLRNQWQIIGESGFFRADLDLTGDLVPEILMGYTVPGGTGALLIAGCVDGRYQAMYEDSADLPEPPRLVVLGDLNNNQTNDVLFAVRACERDDAGQIIDTQNCQYRSRLLTWQPSLSRFTNLLPDNVLSVNPADVTDFDNDQVSEVVVRLESNGNSATGPLRTGVNVYDWDGASYLLSIIQLDPPRFRIQVIQQADRLSADREWAQAIPVYQLALQEGGNLRYWYDDEPEILRSYTFYRLLLAQTIASDVGLALTQQQMSLLYPDALTAPVYIAMAQAFQTTFQTAGDVRSACQAVRAIIAERPEALELLNRYGTRSPRYTESDLCPF